MCEKKKENLERESNAGAYVRRLCVGEAERGNQSLKESPCQLVHFKI